MRKTELLDLPVAKPDPSSVNGRIVKYNACARLHNIRGEMVLSVDCFDATCRSLLYRVFMTRMEYLTAELDGDQRACKWRTGKIGIVLAEYIPRLGYLFPLADRKSKEPIEAFLGCRVDGGLIEALNDYQTDLEEVRRRMKHQKELDRIRKIMEEAKTIPSSFIKWADSEALKSSQYLIYKRIGKKRQKCFCSVCTASFEMAGMKHRQLCTCPNCSATLTAIADGKILSGRIADTVYATMAQPYNGNGIMLRVFKFLRTLVRDGGQWRVETRHTEVLRDILYGNGRYDTFTFGTFKNRDNGLSFFRAHENYFFNYPGSFLCPDGLADELKNTFAKYAALDVLAKHGEAFRPDLYLLFYERYPRVELLAKRGGFWFIRALSEHFNSDPMGDMETIRKHFDDLEDGDLEAVRIWKIVDKSPHPALPEDVNAWKGAPVYRLSELLRFAPLKKIEQYLDHFTGSVGYYASMLADYWMNANRIGMDMRDKRVLYPADLKTAHDDAADRYQIVKSERIEKRLKDRFLELSKRFMFSFDGLCVAIPSSVEDFINESKALCHCVRTYAEKAAFGETTILFVRDEQKPSEPFYTMEIKDGSVQQLRGAHNCKPTENVLRFEKKFCQKFGLAQHIA